MLWTSLLLPLVLATAGCGGSASGTASQGQAAETTEPAEKSLRAVLLGEFSINHTRPLENLKVRLQFSLHATVLEENEQRTAELITNRKHRLRDQVITAVRSAETFEFDEPELLRLRRRIQLRISKVLPDDLLEDLYITEFECHVD